MPAGTVKIAPASALVGHGVSSHVLFLGFSAICSQRRHGRARSWQVLPRGVTGSGSYLKDLTGGREANGLQEARRAGMGAS